MVVLISAMQSGLSPCEWKRLQELVGVSRRTVARWRDWVVQRLYGEPVLACSPGAFVPPVTTTDLPASALKRFAGEAEQQLMLLLRFLAPITTGRGILRAI